MTQHLPIVYIRGYAGSQEEVDDTVATPYMGFNLGSTKLRQRWTGDIERYIFESPLIRLMKDHGYRDVYESGAEPTHGAKIDPRSVWIYRYYEPVSKDLGTAFRPEIEDYAEGLHEFIERIRVHVCGEGKTAKSRAARKSFRVYLVAHSMGGLVARCYLQNICVKRRVTPPVDKIFTYATPHGGIDFRLVGNVPAFLKRNNIDNFNEKRMRAYLKLPRGASVTSLGNAFDPSRFFCLVGTNHRDYGAAGGFSRVAVGPMSDGLVQIKNACVDRAPRAFVHRSHSGHYGIVNSEEGYQNLRRFLFGQVKIDGRLDIHDVTLPEKLQKKADKGKKVKASYHVEAVARVRGVRWDLHRRTVSEESALFVPQERIKKKKPVHLATVYLMEAARVLRRRKTLGFGLDLGVLVPEYEVDGFLFFDDHYDGGYLFRDKINLEVTLGAGKKPALKYGFDSETPNQATHDVPAVPDGSSWTFRIPIEQAARPGIKASLLLTSEPWS